MARSYTTNGTPVATSTSSGRRKKSSGASALAKNKLRAPGTKWAEWRAKSGERWGVARANMQETFSKVGASMKYGMFTATHPMHPVRRKAAKESQKQSKLLATDRKNQQVAAVHSMAAAKNARAREANIAALNQAL